MERRHITLPLTEELAKTLHAGDQVLLTGTIYTSRDAGHKRMCEALARGEKIPFDPTDATIYYVGPTPAKPGAVIGSAGPTTSGRMDAYAPTMMSVGARGMIGKGARLPEVVEAMKKYSGVYFGDTFLSIIYCKKHLCCRFWFVGIWITVSVPGFVLFYGFGIQIR